MRTPPTLESALSRARLLDEVSHALAAVGTEHDRVTELIARRLAEVVGDSCNIRLVTEDGAHLVVSACHHREPEACELLRSILAGMVARLDEGVAGEVFATRATVLLSSPRPEEVRARIKPEFLPFYERVGISSLLLAPLEVRGEIIGVVALSRDGGRPPYTEDDAELVNDLAGRAALAISNAQLVLRLQRAEAALQAANERLEARVKERTEELARSNAELEQFAYIASHDLQAPLRTISGFVELLAKSLVDLTPEQERHLAFITDGVAQMRELITGLLAYSRLGRRREPAVNVALDAVIARVKLALGAAIRESGAEVGASALPVVQADFQQMFVLFQNLVQNAIKYASAERPRVTISARRDGPRGDWRVSVADNGIGIDPAQAERIFQMFKRLHPRDAYGGGSGIGLALAKRIVEQHGGKIWVESSPGAGATFHFTLPAA